jgi:hypothetical protein
MENSEVQKRLMFDADIKVCIIVILNFIVMSEEEAYNLGIVDIPSATNKDSKLAEFGYDYITFTQYLANGEKLWDKCVTEFFWDKDKCLKFFINKLKSY